MFDFDGETVQVDVDVEGWGEPPRDVGGVPRCEASDSSDSDESCSRSSRCGPFRCVCEVLVMLALDETHFREAHLNKYSKNAI